MRRFITHILLFLVIVSIIDITVGCVGDYLVNYVKGGDTKRTNDLVMKDFHDIIILGSSRARHHYDAPLMSDTLGLDVYNAGYDGNGVVLAYGLIEMILERYRPKLIIYDVEPAFDVNVYESDNNHKRYITKLKPYYRRQTISDIIEDVSSEEWYKIHSGMMRYNMSILTMLMDNTRRGYDSNKGYTPLEGVYDSEPKQEYEHRKFDKFKLKYIEKLIKTSKSKEIPIILVASPKYGKNSSSELQPVIDICIRNNIEFFDYYSDFEFMQHKEWFKEPMHLNSIGARAFTQSIITQIKEKI